MAVGEALGECANRHAQHRRQYIYIRGIKLPKLAEVRKFSICHYIQFITELSEFNCTVREVPSLSSQLRVTMATVRTCP